MKQKFIFSLFVLLNTTLSAQYTVIPHFQTPLGIVDVKYPKNWKINIDKKYPYNFKAYLPNNQYIVSLSFIALPQGKTPSLKDLVQVNIAQIKKTIHNGIFISSKGIKINQYNIQELIYQGEVNGRMFKWRQLLFMEGSFNYALTFTADAQVYDYYVDLSDTFFNAFILKK